MPTISANSRHTMLFYDPNSFCIQHSTAVCAAIAELLDSCLIWFIRVFECVSVAGSKILRCQLVLFSGMDLSANSAPGWLQQ